jgi:hypothetical protein
MRNFYLEYSHNTILQSSVAEIKELENLALPVREIGDANKQPIELKNGKTKLASQCEK